MQRLVVCVLTFILAVTINAVAQTADTTHYPTGTLIGHVVDSARNPLIGAAIRIVGTPLETCSKAPDGSFTLTGIGVGDYTVQVTSVGYPTRELRVRIAENAKTNIIAKLEEGNVALGKVHVIICHQYISSPERFGSTSIITAEDLDRLP